MSMTVTSTAAARMRAEFQEEAAITKRVLERVPEDKLTWKPHPKSMTLGQLAGTLRRFRAGFLAGRIRGASMS